LLKAGHISCFSHLFFFLTPNKEDRNEADSNHQPWIPLSGQKSPCRFNKIEVKRVVGLSKKPPINYREW
jgi:hypothetical protein